MIIWGEILEESMVTLKKYDLYLFEKLKGTSLTLHTLKIIVIQLNIHCKKNKVDLTVKYVKWGEYDSILLFL